MKRRTAHYLFLVAVSATALVLYENSKPKPDPVVFMPNISTDSTNESYYNEGNSETEPVEIITTTVSEAASSEAAIFTERVNLNTGTFEEFAAIPILTEEQAHAIIELREAIDYFSHYYELLYAEGFDEELVAALDEYVYVESQN